MFTAQGEWVLIVQKRETTTPSGLVLPDASNDEFFTGTVLSIGSDVLDEEVTSKLSVGDKVVVARGGRWKIGKIKDSLVYAVPYGDIVCTVDDEN